MGATNWSDKHYDDKVAFRAKTGTKTFAYDDDIKTGKTAAKCHDKLNPFGVKLRESRDSDLHPESLPIAIVFDQTGSMQTVPTIMQRELKKVMQLLIRKGYVEHPQIMVGAFGDIPNGEKAPCQIGQFESGIEIENDLTNLYLEGNGGGTSQESSEMVMYFVARHTVTDAWEKRGKKGYLFIITDETTHPKVNRDEVKRIIGDDIQESIAIKDIINELQEKWNLYVIIPNSTHHYNDGGVIKYWRDLIGQNYLKLDDPEGICELIASCVGVSEGKVDLEDLTRDLTSVGTSKSIASAVSKALVPVATGKAPKGGMIKAPDSGVGSGVATL